MSFNGKNALVTGSSRGIGRGIIDWTGDVICALVRIVSMWRQEVGSVHEPGHQEDDAGLAGDDNFIPSRTIRWSDGRHMTLRWKLPSPGR